MRLDRSEPASVLAVYAHPDDPEVSCGGALATWASSGARVYLVLVNQGDKGSNDPGVDGAALARIRAAEVDAAARVLDIESITMLGRPDGDSDNDHALRGDLVERIRRVRPEVVVCPDPTAVFFGDGYVNHRDHRICGWATIDAVGAAASPLYFAGLGSAHQVERLYLSGTLEPDTAVAITDVLERKARALACHRSQLGGAGEWVHDLVEQRAQEAGRAIGVAHAETFRVVRLAGAL